MSAPAALGRDFRLLWVGETTSQFGTSVTSLALPLVAVVDLHAGAFAVGLLAAAAWLPWLVIGLPAGAWVDRLARRPLMLGCDLLCILLLASVPVAAWFGVLTVGQLLCVALLVGAVKVFFQTAWHAYLPALVGPAAVGAANSRLQATESAAQIGGLGCGGLVARLFGAANGLLADAVTFGVSAGCLLGIRTPEPRPAAAARTAGLRAEIATGLRFVRQDHYLLVLTVFGSVANLALTGGEVVQVVFLVRTVGIGQGTVGLLIALGSAGGVVGALLATRIADRIGTARAIVLLPLAGYPFALLVPLTGPGWRLAFMVVGLFVMSATVVANNVVRGTFRQTYTPPELLGRVTTSMQFLNYGSIPLAGLLGGALGSTIGPRSTLWVMESLLTASVLIVLASRIRRLRDMPTAPERELVPC